MRGVDLRKPFISAPMDTVTDGRSAFCLANEGCIGIVNRSYTIEDQYNQVKMVSDWGLPVGAAIDVTTSYTERLEALIAAGITLLVADSAHGHQDVLIEAIKAIRSGYPLLPIMAGNTATYEGTLALFIAGADCARIGMGPGSICTTRLVSGMGVPQVTALIDAQRAALEFGNNVTFVADGGIHFLGDSVKALALGASAVMMGSQFAGCTESPAPWIRVRAKDVPDIYKWILRKGAHSYWFRGYRGMGSAAALKHGRETRSGSEFHGKAYDSKRTFVAEGVEGSVPWTGTIQELAGKMSSALESGMFYTGSQTLARLAEDPVFYEGSANVLAESLPHDIWVTPF